MKNQNWLLIINVKLPGRDELNVTRRFTEKKPEIHREKQERDRRQGKCRGKCRSGNGNTNVRQWTYTGQAFAADVKKQGYSGVRRQ